MTTTKQSVSVAIRWLVRHDYDDVLDIEDSSEFGWTLDVLHHHQCQRNVVGMVAEHGEKVVGFFVYALYRDRFALLNFAVHPYYRRLGVGRQMIAKLVGKLSGDRRNRIVANIHESNLPMQLFLRANGFKAERVDGEFYRFVRRLTESARRVAELMGD